MKAKKPNPANRIETELNGVPACELWKLARQPGGLGEDQLPDARDVIERSERGTTARTLSAAAIMRPCPACW